MRDKKNKGIYPWIKSIFEKQKRNPAEAVYAGPEYFSRDPATEEVYAGPGFFEKGDPDEPIIEEEEQSEEQKPIDLVYAGPEKIERPPEPVMMAVYAGPEYFSGQSGRLGSFAPSVEEPKEEDETVADGKKCPRCGHTCPEDAPFCSECGTPFPKDEEE